MFAIVIFVPATHGEAVREALATAGGGSGGNYDSCSFSCAGKGRFRPLAGANPAIGSINQVAVVDEERIETVVRGDIVSKVVRAVRKAHPYEEPAIQVSQIIDYKSFMPEDDAAGSGGSTAAVATSLAGVRLPVSIVLEGLDGVGKSTAAKLLAQRLGAKYLRTPPDQMQQYRNYFHDQSKRTDADVVKRETYYMVGNFAAGYEMKSLFEEGKSCVIDRYYASTRAYLLGKDVSQPLPDAESPAYAWPEPLPKPQHMILLTLPESDRIARRGGRTTVNETAEEALLREHAVISDRINEAYRRFGCTEVKLAPGDAAEAVVDKIIAAIQTRPLSPS